VEVDASEGVYAPAAVSIKEIYRGDRAVSMNNDYSAASAEQRDNSMREEAKGFFDTFTVKSSSIQFDKPSRTLTISIDGTAKINWKDGWAYVPTSTIAFDADFERPAGPNQMVPFNVTYPSFDKDVAILRLPHGVAAEQKISAPVHQTLAGIEYERSETVDGETLTVESSERSVAPEIAYKDAVAAQTRLRALFKDDVYVRVPDGYRATKSDLPALAEQTPTSADDYVTRGNTFLTSGKNEEAIADFTAALKLDPSNEWALADRAIAYAWKRKLDDAEKDLTAVEARNPDNPVALRARGLVAEYRHDCAKAVRFYTQSLAKETSTFSLWHRATCEAELSNYDAALADSAEVLKDDPPDTDLRLMRVNIFIRRGNHEAAAAEADAMIREDPKSNFALVSAAKSYAAIDQREKGLQLLDRAIALKPSASIYVDRAEIRALGDITGKMADLDQALKLDPDHSRALVEKAFLLAEQGKYSDALPFYDRAIKTDKSVETAANRAVALYKAGRKADAEQAFQQARSLAKSPVELNDLCWIKATSDVLLESALTDCNDALKSRPDTGPFLDSLGMVLLKLGKLDEALDAYNKAIAKDTGADSLMGRAFVYARKGDKVHADLDAAAARKIYPAIDGTFAVYGLKFDQPMAPEKVASAKAGAATAGK
jgi:tetratricopeptide (TPR) repeat protein